MINMKIMIFRIYDVSKTIYIQIMNILKIELITYFESRLFFCMIFKFVNDLNIVFKISDVF